MELAEAFAEPTGARADLLVFLFSHADEVGLGPAPPACTRDMFVMLRCVSTAGVVADTRPQRAPLQLKTCQVS
jgi:hypothetical protein